MIGHGVPGLYIQQSHVFDASCARVFTALTEGLNAWWPRNWRQAGSTSLLSLPAEIGAVMTESGTDGAAIWGWVDRFVAGRCLHLQGHFGVDGAVAGRVHFDLIETPQGCELALTHQAIGPVPEDRGAQIRAMWRDALGRHLRDHLLGVAV